MLVRTLLLAVPLVLLGAGTDSQSSDSSSSSSQATREKDDKTSLPGPSGAKDQGGAGANTGTAGAREQTAAGEKGDTTSGAKSGRWDESGGKTPREGAASGGPPRADEARPPGHAGDSTVAGKLSQVSGGSITIQTGPGTSQTLKLVPQTKITSGGKDADHTDLKEGQQVRASYMEHGGEQVAVTVHAASAASDEPTGEKTHNPRNNPQTDQKR